MADRETQPKEGKQQRRSLFRFDLVLLAFLVVGWSLIFITATLGLQRSDQQWLPVGLVANVAADYSPAPTEAFKLARINPDVIDAIRQDQILRLSTPTPSPLAQTSTPMPTATATATPFIGELVVSAGGPYNGQEGSLIRVTASDTGILGTVQGIISYAWDLDNDGQYDDAVGNSTAVKFFDEGEYPISVQASDWLGRIDTDTTLVYLSNAPPIVNIGQDIKTSEGQEVTFAATASDSGQDLLFYEWAFGDDSPLIKDTLRPRHTYVDDGSYTARLRVRDNDGGITEDFLTVEVGNLPPLVDAGSDLVTTEGSKVALSGKATDPGITDELAYAWDFNYDGKTFTPDWDGQTASIVYPDGPANIVAGLRVRDDKGTEAIDTVKVTVNNVPPVITGVSNDSPVGEGSELALTVSATDVGKDDRLTYSFDWDGDGSFEAVKQPATTSNIWYNQDDYTVRIRVDDGDGGQAFTTTTVSVTNEPPVAVARVESGILEGSPVTFDAGDSQDPGRDDILTYEWNMGDGSSVTGKTVSHVYADNKVYSTTLTVTDDSGAASTTAAPVTILNANPTANVGPDVTLNENNLQLSLNGTATDPGAADAPPNLTFDWKCNNGNNATFEESPDVTGSTPTCTYSGLDGLRDSNSTSFNVTLRVRDKDYPYPTDGGGQIGEASDSLRVRIKNVPPWDVCINAPVSHCSTTDRPEYRTTRGVVLDFTASGTDVSPDLPHLTFRWDYNYDGSTFTEDDTNQNVRHAWTTRGVYRVRLQVEDDDGGVTPAEIRVNVGGVPTAVASAVPNPVGEGTLIALTSRGSSDPDGDDLAYRWNFGDGSAILNTSDITVTHSYSDDGIYTATLFVDDNRGGTDTVTATVTVTNVIPTAVANFIPPANEGQPVNFTATGSAAGQNEPLTYQWNFSDGGTALGITPIYTFTDNGNYSAILTVTDDDGSSNATTVAVPVDNIPPLVEANVPNGGLQGQQITLTGSATDVSADVLTYAWDFDYDGSNFNVDDTGQTVVNTWALGDRYTVALRVTDDDGGTGIDTASVDINSIPIASAGGPYGGNEGAEIAFNGSGSSDPDPGDNLAYTWDFGDGSVAGTEINPGHTYAENGVYNVTLQVDDGQGGVAIATTTATVNNLPPVANAAGPTQPVAEGDTVPFTGGGSDPGGGSIIFAWDLDGDGQFDDANTAATSYSWGEQGTYTVVLQVTDAGGLSSTATVQVTVTNLPPVANIGNVPPVVEGQTVNLNGGNSSDPGGGALTYAWDLDGDGQFDDANTATASFTRDEPGDFPVSLQVTDAQGSSNTTTIQVTVDNQAPTANAGPDQTATVGAAVTFDGSSSSDPGGGALTYAWDLDDDGQFDDADTATVSFTWDLAGDFPVSLRVTDAQGLSNTDTAQVTVNP